jgi:pimeloyl-ACP methyl ester carboxylesterase
VPVIYPTDNGNESGEIAARIVMPPPEIRPANPAVLFCMPGGAFSKNYFDLDPNGSEGYSFAADMAERGHVVVAIDHLGVGESTLPKDGYVLHPDVVSATNNAAVSTIKEALHAGLDGLPPLPTFTSIGVGHSMGGMLTAVTQSHFRPYQAIIIMASSAYGLPDGLDTDFRALAHKPALFRAQLVPLLRSKKIGPYLPLDWSERSREMPNGGEPNGILALRGARADVIAPCGWTSMTPGSWAPEAASIDVPLLLFFGDDDLCREPHTIPALFKSCPDVTLHILPKTGHNHMVFASRKRMFKRIDRWLKDVTPTLS